jgi:death-on-curing family protein
MNILPLTIREVEFVAHRLAQETLAWDEPIPSFNTRFPKVLESCLAAPFQTYGGRVLYKGLEEKASILFYLMVKNHPFANGNKRIAITTLLYLLLKNGKWLTVDQTEFYNFAKWVAESNPKFRQETVAAIGKFVRLNLVSSSS